MLMLERYKLDKNPSDACAAHLTVQNEDLPPLGHPFQAQIISSGSHYHLRVMFSRGEIECREIPYDLLANCSQLEMDIWDGDKQLYRRSVPLSSVPF